MCSEEGRRRLVLLTDSAQVFAWEGEEIRRRPQAGSVFWG